MFIVITPTNPDPLYKQVIDQIKEAIADGSLLPETRLPSIREMARELGISPITIKRAYRDLESEEYIMTRAGLGSFVADINRERLRNEKLVELKAELNRILLAAEKVGVSIEEVERIIREIKEG